MAEKENQICVCMESYTTRLGTQVLLGTQLMEYGPTHHTIISFSLKIILSVDIHHT